MSMEIRVIENADGSRTASCGAWVLMRVFVDGRVREIQSMEAPSEMRKAAMDALGLCDTPFGVRKESKHG